MAGFAPSFASPTQVVTTIGIGGQVWIGMDGRIQWNMHKVRLTNQSHETMGVLGIYEDVTKRKQADERLRQLSIVFEQSPTSRPAFSMSAAEVIGQNPSMLQSQLMAKKVYADMWKTLTQGLVWHGELINQRKDGQAYWEDSQIAPVRNAQGVITHYVAIKTDVTERVRSSEKI